MENQVNIIVKVREKFSLLHFERNKHEECKEIQQSLAIEISS